MRMRYNENADTMRMREKYLNYASRVLACQDFLSNITNLFPPFSTNFSELSTGLSTELSTTIPFKTLDAQLDTAIYYVRRYSCQTKHI